MRDHPCFVSEKETGIRAGGSRDEFVEVIFGSDQDTCDPGGTKPCWMFWR